MVENLEVKEKLWKLIDDTTEELLTLCSELIQRPSLNPPIEPDKIIDYIKDYLQKWNISYKIVGLGPHLPIIVVEIGEGDDFTLCFNGHSDVVNPGDLDKWDFDPHCGTITETQVLGRGSSDMLCGMAIDLHLIRLIIEHDIKINGKIVMHIVPDEESGGKYGTGWLLDNGYLNNIDACILGEPTSWDNIETGSKGGMWTNVESFGTQSHASIESFIGDNAIVKLCTFLGRLDELREEPAKMIKGQEEVISQSKRIAEKNFNNKAVRDAIDHVTYNIHTIKSGKEGLGDGEYSTAGIQFRIPNGIKGEDLKAKFLKIAEECSVKAKIENLLEATYTPVTEPLVQSAVKNSTYLWKKEVVPVFQWASSDGRYYRSKGIPTIQNGPCNDGIHGYNETADIEEIVTIAKNHIAIACDLLKIEF